MASFAARSEGYGQEVVIVRALVTGALGFSGSWVVRTLLDEGWKVVGVDLPRVLDDPRRRTVAAQVGLSLDHPGLQLRGADLVDRASLDGLFDGIDYVFHTASLYDYSAPLERLRKVNVGGVRNLLDAIGRADSVRRLVHWSTCGVFGKPYPPSDPVRGNTPFDEDSPSPKNSPPDATQPRGTHLVNAYSVSKWEQEQLVWRAHREGVVPVTVIRPAPIYGPGSDYGHCGIILQIARGRVPFIPADARNAITTSVHVVDVARFALFAATNPDAEGEDYNVVDNSIISYQEFLHYIALLVGRRMWDVPGLPLPALRPLAIGAATAWTWAEKALGLPRVRVFEVQSATYIGSSYWLSNRKTLRAGFHYEYPDVREGLKDTVAWMRRNGWFDPSRRAQTPSEEDGGGA